MSPLSPILSSARFMSNVVVGYSATTLITTLLRVGNDFVVVVAFGVTGDDIPGVEEAGKVAEHAEEDV